MPDQTPVDRTMITAQNQIDQLADFIMTEIPGEPSRSEGAVDTAIRLLRSMARAAPDSVPAANPAAAATPASRPPLLNRKPRILLRSDGNWVTARDAHGTGIAMHVNEGAALRHAHNNPGRRVYWWNGKELPISGLPPLPDRMRAAAETLAEASARKYGAGVRGSWDEDGLMNNAAEFEREDLTGEVQP